VLNQKRLALHLQGLLQGIGFRPFVYRLATQYQQTGWVANDNQHVVLEIQGYSAQQTAFLAALQNQVPACGKITQLEIKQIPVLNEAHFQLRASLQNDNEKSFFVCPDIAICPDCVAELFNPSNRRYLHPFISCCHCGPRYSLMQKLPYDRCNTTLQAFPLCPACVAEYQNPADRRFHAQTIACHQCGPQLSLHDAQGWLIASQQSAWEFAITQLQAGKIVALKSVGGFQLVVDASNQAAVLQLRQRKMRPDKPFALLVASLAEAEKLCQLSEVERHLLTSAAAPIVLSKAKTGLTLAPAVAPQQALLGLMLPYTPLHHLLSHAMNAPLVATSANLQDEPICINNSQAMQTLAGIADFFLCHDRPILRALDDSLVRVIAGKATVLRRARGYVPTPISLNYTLPAVLAVGGQTKNTVAIAQKQQVILSQHLGDLTALATRQHFSQTIADLSHFYACQPQQILCDTHPDYVSSQYAHQQALPVQTVQHHYAHALSCMAEHSLPPPVLAVAWDGTGLGTDKQLWGGEFFSITGNGWQRFASVRPFPLIGGFQAIKEPRRFALGLLYGCYGEALFSGEFVPLLTAFSLNEQSLFHAMLKKSLNCPLTSSIGRLFDGVASLLNVCHSTGFEGQAAMAVEQLAMQVSHQEMLKQASYYPFPVCETEPLLLDWQPLIMALLADMPQLSGAEIAAKFHYSLADALLTVLARKTKANDLAIVCSGGCFQNAYLVEAISALNQQHHYRLFFQQQIPPNDGGLALGQILAYAFSHSIPYPF